MTRPTETTRRRLPTLHVGRKPGDRIGIAGGDRPARHTTKGSGLGGRTTESGDKGPVGLEVALERRQVIGGLGGAIKKDHDEGDRTGTRSTVNLLDYRLNRSWISSSEEENFRKKFLKEIELDDPRMKPTGFRKLKGFFTVSQNGCLRQNKCENSYKTQAPRGPRPILRLEKVGRKQGPGQPRHLGPLL
ncbi:hypothetical protein BY996DRAFT_8390800 [Phakopsora pachyrhizi]|nr:hypothetical protein BY996DRAFT_8390800 [Phakopsora pachyrhizi]